MANFLEALKKPFKKVGQTIGSLFTPKTTPTPTPAPTPIVSPPVSRPTTPIQPTPQSLKLPITMSDIFTAKPQVAPQPAPQPTFLQRMGATLSKTLEDTIRPFVPTDEEYIRKIDNFESTMKTFETISREMTIPGIRSLVGAENWDKHIKPALPEVLKQEPETKVGPAIGSFVYNAVALHFLAQGLGVAGAKLSPVAKEMSSRAPGLFNSLKYGASHSLLRQFKIDSDTMASERAKIFATNLPADLTFAFAFGIKDMKTAIGTSFTGQFISSKLEGKSNTEAFSDGLTASAIVSLFKLPPIIFSKDTFREQALKQLGLKESATQAEAHKAWRELARKYHPDRLGGDAEKFKAINNAYQALTGNYTSLKGDVLTELKDFWNYLQTNDARGTAIQIVRDFAPGLTIKDVSGEVPTPKPEGKKTPEIVPEGKDIQKVPEGEARITPAPETIIPPAEVPKEKLTLSEMLDRVEPTEIAKTEKVTDMFKGEAPVAEPAMTTEEQITKRLNDEIDKAELSVLAEMELAEAGQRIVTDQDVIGVPSSFPKWVPSHLRQRELFNKVIGHIENKTIPLEKHTRQKELYDLVQDEMGKRIDKDLLSEKELLEIAKQSPIKAGIVKKLIPPSAQEILGIEPSPFVRKREYTLLKDKFRNLARGGREGSIYTRKQIVEKQTEFANILKQSGLTPKDQSKFISELRNIAKSPEPGINFYNKFPEIQSRIENLLDAQTKRDLSKVLDRELKYTKPLKKGDHRVAKYEYEYNKILEELRKARKLNQEQAQTKLDELDLIRGGRTEGISEFDLIKERFYSLQANGAKASVEIHEKVLEDIQRLKRIGAESKDIDDFLKKIERTEKVDEVFNKIVELRPKELRDVNFIKKTMNAIASGYHGGVSNIGSYLNQLVGKDLSERYDPELRQSRLETSYYYRAKDINKKAIKILDLKNDSGLMKWFVDMAKEKTILTDIDGVNSEFNKLQLIGIYNNIKNDHTRELYHWAYGEQQIKSALSSLTDSEKMVGDMMMEEIKYTWEILNKRHIEIKGRDMGRVEDNYFPRTTEHRANVFDDMRIQGETPSAMKARSHSTRMIPTPTNFWTTGMKSIRIAEHVDHLSREYETLRRIFTDRRVKGAIINRYGNKIYRDLNQHIASISLNKEVARTNIVDDTFSKALNNWVSAKMFSPTVFARQLASTTNYMRHMPALEWTAGFMEGVATPAKTAKYMLDRFDFLHARFNRGYDETMKDAILGGNHLKVRANSWKAIGTLPTRVGDITAIIYGGYPFVQYLDKEAAEKGLKGKEAEDYVRDKYERITNKEQQFGGSTGLSLPQQSAGATKLFYRFRNTVSQYLRLVVDTTIQAKRKEVSPEFLGKTYFHYIFLQALLYSVIGAGVVGGYKALIRQLTGASKKEDKDANLAADAAIFMVTQPFTAVPFLGEAMEYTIRKKAGLKSYSMVSTPMLDDIERGFQSALKNEPTLEDYLRFVAAIEEPALGFPIETFLRYYGYATEETKEPKKKKKKGKSLDQLTEELGLPPLTGGIPEAKTKKSGKSTDELTKELGLPPLNPLK